MWFDNMSYLIFGVESLIWDLMQSRDWIESDWASKNLCGHQSSVVVVARTINSFMAIWLILNDCLLGLKSKPFPIIVVVAVVLMKNEISSICESQSRAALHEIKSLNKHSIQHWLFTIQDGYHSIILLIVLSWFWFQTSWIISLISDSDKSCTEFTPRESSHLDPAFGHSADRHRPS